MTGKSKILAAARVVLVALGLPKAQQNERSALCLLALLDLTPDKHWEQASNPLVGITPIMAWAHKHYRKAYAPNTRETFRRQTMHQFVDAGLALCNPDKPERPVNSPQVKYQIEPGALNLLRTFGSKEWKGSLATYLASRETLVARYAMERERKRVPVQIADDKNITLSVGEHSELIRAVVEAFAPCFVPGAVLVYVGDTGTKWGYFDSSALADLGIKLDAHGKMPDVVLHDTRRNWLILVECVTSHGPVDGKRHAELAGLFTDATAGLVYVTAFPSRTLMGRYLGAIAWETEVWCADAPSHLIHFNGERFLGPYGSRPGRVEASMSRSKRDSMPPRSAYDRALGMLARREYSQRELRARLERAGCDENESSSALKRLREQEYQDDDRFGEMIVRARVGQGYGPDRIRAELRSHALSDSAIRALLEAADTDWLALARAQLRKKYGGKPPADHAERGKCAAFLMRRGFAAATVRIVTHSDVESSGD